MMLNLNDLYYFVQMVEHGGLAAAGRALGIAKSTLSKRLLELEKDTGTRLIQRNSRNFVMTEVGMDVYRHAAAMLIEAESVENVIAGRLAEPNGMVRITAAVPIAQHKLAPLLPRLAIDYPKIRIVVHATDRFVDIVQEGFDIAVRAHRGRLPDSDLVQRHIGFEPNWLVASPDYLKRAGSPANPEELSGHDGIVIAPSESTWSLENGEGARVVAAPSPRYFADESELLLQAARAGLGIACVPSELFRLPIEAGELVHVLPAWTAGGVTTTLLQPHRRGQLPSVKVVADALVAGHAESASRRTEEAASPKK
jgi:DNA-binding transcriptional LysR family regulator